MLRFLRDSLRFPRALPLAGLALAMALSLSGCGDSRENSPPAPAPNPPSEPPTGTAPTAVFAAADSAAMNTPVVFDASGSTAADGSELQYFWNFGGGQRGGGEIIARQFATPGTNNVTLTVVDGGGRSATQSKAITIAAPTTPPATITAQGSVTTVAEIVLQGVTVTPFGAAAGATTDAMGKVSVSLAVGVPLALKLSKEGYADQFVSLQMPETAGADAYFEAVMRPRDAALTLADAAAGGSLNGRDGATITLPANALVDTTNTPVTGAVLIAMTPVDITQPGAGGFPGSFDGITPSGATTPIVSFGTTEYVLTANGGSLQLAPGKTAVIEMPLYASENLDGTMLTIGDTTPLWSLDEATGIWVQEGSGTVVASAASPTGLALRATVSHFTWWNSDIGFEPYGPRPRCVYDDDIGIPGANDTFATATICNMLAEIDRGLGGSGSAKMSIAAESPRIAGFSRRVSLPIAGDVTVPVPANVDVALSATALNGTWVGRRVVNGPVGVQAPVLIEMRPLDSTGPDPDTVALPFDGSRTLETNQTALFTFNGVALRYARITVTPVDGSSLVGNVRLLQGASVLATSTFGGLPQPIVAMLPAATLYTVEITGTSGTPGGYRLQIELVGTSSSEALTVPFRIDTAPVPQLTVLQKTFDIATPMTGHIAFQQKNNENARGSLVGPGGLLYNFSRIGADRTESTVLNLAPGSYSLTVGGVRGNAAAYSAKVERTEWEHIAPPLEGITSTFDLIDAVADRNGRPVLGYIRVFNNNGHSSAALIFKRWTGSAWEDVGTELIVDEPCGSNAFVSFDFDSANNPVVAYGNQQASASFTSVRRFTGGAWQAMGPNNGVLPQSDAFSGACRVTPIVQVGASDQLFVAYEGGNDFYVQRFDGANWIDVVPGGSTFSASGGGSYELRAGPDGRIWFVLANPNGVVRRFNPTPTPAWETIGPNAGALPSAANTIGIAGPRLRFDASGNPLIGATAAVGSGGTSSSGVIVYRYNSTAWSTTGGFQTTGNNSRSSGERTHSFAVWNGEAITAWINNFSGTTADTVLLAQRNTASGWTAIGADDGRLPQFTPDGTVTLAAITQLQAWQTRMVAIGSELYMGVVVTSTNNDGTPRRVYLLRKSAN